CRDAADQRQRGLVAIGLEQPRERLVDGPRAEVGEAARAPHGRAAQAVGVERRRMHADALERSSAEVQGAHGARHASRCEAHFGVSGGRFAAILAAAFWPRNESAAMTPDEIRGLIKDVPDFPQPGIVFKDITPVLAAPAAFRAATELLAERAARHGADAILAIEARGFVFGAALARELKLPLELVRKRGKLPRKSLSVRYELEYGFDHLEVHEDALR